MRTQEEKNIQAKKERVSNVFDNCIGCTHKWYCYSFKDGTDFYVCGYFREVLNGVVRAKICFDIFGIAGENKGAG